MRLLVAAGGTGGGVYPALATMAALQALPELAGALQVQWVGTVGGMEAELVRRAGLPYVQIEGSAVAGVGLLRGLGGLVRLARGAVQAAAIVRRYRPDVLLVTGGYPAVGVTLACGLQRVPAAVFLPDVEPGKAIRFASRLAQAVLVAREESRRFFQPAKVVVTGYPVRPELLQAARVDKDEARRHFGLAPDRATLLVFGGSRGARSLNQALLGSLPELLGQTDLQVVHISGQLDWPTVQVRRAELPEQARGHYKAFPYLHEDMGLAFAAADLAVARAGAATLGELPIFGLGAILVPYPHAWRYQKVNADTLQARGAAIRIDDEDLAEKLLPTIRALFGDRSRLQAMGSAARALALPDAAGRVAAELKRLAVESDRS